MNISKPEPLVVRGSRIQTKSDVGKKYRVQIEQKKVTLFFFMQ